MKFCIIMMTCATDARWLPDLYPLLKSTGFPIYVLENNANAAVRALDAQYADKVFIRPYDGKMGTARNTLADYAHQAGFDAAFSIDPDEAIWPEHIQDMPRWLESFDALRLPRYCFVRDKQHIAPHFYPDWQDRVFRLGKGVTYFPEQHATFNRSCDALGLRLGAMPHAHLYHYSWLRPLKEIAYFYVNAPRMRDKLPSLDYADFTVPPEWHYPESVPCSVEHPVLKDAPIAPQLEDRWFEVMPYDKPE